MEVYYFTELPYTAFPESEADKFPSMRLTFPNTYFDPRTAHDLFKRYLDEYQYAEDVGFGRPDDQRAPQYTFVHGRRWLTSPAASWPAIPPGPRY